MRRYLSIRPRGPTSKQRHRSRSQVPRLSPPWQPEVQAGHPGDKIIGTASPNWENPTTFVWPSQLLLLLNISTTNAFISCHLSFKRHVEFGACMRCVWRVKWTRITVDEMPIQIWWGSPFGLAVPIILSPGCRRTPACQEASPVNGKEHASRVWRIRALPSRGVC